MALGLSSAGVVVDFPWSRLTGAADRLCPRGQERAPPPHLETMTKVAFGLSVGAFTEPLLCAECSGRTVYACTRKENGSSLGRHCWWAARGEMKGVSSGVPFFLSTWLTGLGQVTQSPQALVSISVKRADTLAPGQCYQD